MPSGLSWSLLKLLPWPPDLLMVGHGDSLAFIKWQELPTLPTDKVSSCLLPWLYLLPDCIFTLLVWDSPIIFYAWSFIHWSNQYLLGKLRHADSDYTDLVENGGEKSLWNQANGTYEDLTLVISSHFSWFSPQKLHTCLFHNRPRMHWHREAMISFSVLSKWAGKVPSLAGVFLDRNNPLSRQRPCSSPTHVFPLQQIRSAVWWTATLQYLTSTQIPTITHQVFLQQREETL